MNKEQIKRFSYAVYLLSIAELKMPKRDMDEEKYSQLIKCFDKIFDILADCDTRTQ